MASTKEVLVKNQLDWDSRILSTGIQVEVNDSTAILTGVVPSSFQKKIAGQDALTIEGIFDVENKLIVSHPEEYKAKPDSEIKSSIENILLWDSRLDSTGIVVYVDAGLVTLEGSVDAYWKKAVAEDLVHNVYGVTDVVNNLNIVWTASFEDEIIAAEVRDALDRSIIASENITVDVVGGVVTLSGSVPLITDKKIARDKAEFTAGVVDVIDDLEVI